MSKFWEHDPNDLLHIVYVRKKQGQTKTTLDRKHKWGNTFSGTSVGIKIGRVQCTQVSSTLQKSNFLLLIIHSFIQATSIAPLQVHYYSEVLQTQHGYSVRVSCRSFTPKRHRQLWVKDLPKVPTWRLERDSNLRPFGRKTSNLPMSQATMRMGYRRSQNIIGWH